jgi:hypothetical protein
MFPKASQFSFDKYRLDYPAQSIHFDYSYVMETGEKLAFTETLTLPEPLREDVMNRIDIVHTLEALHLLLGTSYFKMFAPPQMTHPYSFTQAQADFWNLIYTQGMGEFYYTNQLDFRGLVNFTPSSDRSPVIDSHFTSEKALIQHGGGKDSLLSVEITKMAGVVFDLFSMNSSAIQELAAQAVGKELNVIKRKVDPKMVEITKAGQALNGHVPITVMYAFVSLLYSLIHQYGYVVASNEASASYGSVEYLGIDVNHQWAKSFESERNIRSYIENSISRDVNYFSLLRPLHEIKIVESFSKLEQYFTSFSSSNHNFTMVQGRQSRWDVEYSKGKVEFVFALFTAFLPKEKVMIIFGDNYYAHESLLARYMELLGKKDIKPLDCVGTPDEVTVAMYMAYESGEYAGDPIMKYFESDILPEVKDHIGEMKQRVMSYGNDSLIPEIFKDALRPTTS